MWVGWGKMTRKYPSHTRRQEILLCHTWCRTQSGWWVASCDDVEWLDLLGEPVYQGLEALLQVQLAQADHGVLPAVVHPDLHHRVKLHGMGWNGMRWDGVRWDGVEVMGDGGVWCVVCGVSCVVLLLVMIVGGGGRSSDVAVVIVNDCKSNNNIRMTTSKTKH